MVSLKVLQVQARTSNGWQTPYDMDSPVVVVWGPIETGKTSLLDAIAFVFGRDVSFKGVVEHHLRAVRLIVQIGGITYTMTRSRKNKSMVTVRDAGGTTERQLQTQRRTPEQETLSDWLCARLRLDDALAAIRLPGNKGTATFDTAVLPFCYRTQDDIDRQIIMPASFDALRVTVFKLLMNLTTTAYEREAGELRDAENHLRRRREAAVAISKFLDEEPATNLESLDKRITELSDLRIAALQRVTEAKARSTAVEQQDQYYDRLITSASLEWASADAEHERIMRKYNQVNAGIEECEASLDELAEREKRPPVEQRMIHGIVESCQFCGGKVPRGPLQPGQCFMCGGLRRGVVQPAERARLEQILADARTERAELERQRKTAATAIDDAKRRKAQLRQQRDERTRFPLPYLGAVADAEKELGALEGELKARHAARASAARAHHLLQEIARLEHAHREREDKHALDTAGLTPVAELLDDIREIFVSIVDGINPPHWTHRPLVKGGLG